MAATIVPPDNAAQALPRKRFSREDVDEMLEAGLFAGQRYELIDGDFEHPNLFRRETVSMEGSDRTVRRASPAARSRWIEL